MIFSARKKTLMSLFVFLTAALGNAGTTLYLPALVRIGEDLHASPAWMQLSLSTYLMSIGISQVFYGPLSDAFGRRINLLVGLLIFFLGSLCSMWAGSTEILLLGRMIQGLGIGAANAVGFALLRDLYEGKQLLLQLSYLSLFVGISPIIAPIIGGYLVTYISWRACFALLAILAFALWMSKYCALSETNLSLNRHAYKPKVVLKNFWTLLRDVKFLGFTLSVSMGFASLLTFNAVLPFVFINLLHIPPTTYGWLTICTGGGYVLGAYLGGVIGNKFGLLRTLMFSVIIEICASVIGLVIAVDHVTILGVLIPLIFLMIAIGAMIPLGSSGAMKLFPSMAGSSGALLATAMFVIASVFTVIASKMREESASSLFVMLLIMSIITMLVMVLIREKKKPHGLHK